MARKKNRQSGRYKKVCITDPDATMATNGRNRRLEPAYKQQHAVVDDVCGVVLDVVATTGEINEGQVVLERIDAAAATTGQTIITVTADADCRWRDCPKEYGPHTTITGTPLSIRLGWSPETELVSKLEPGQSSVHSALPDR